MIRYYKLLDMMNRRGIKKKDLREFLSPKTIAKLSKGEYVSGEVIDKLCAFLQCQPGDIMEYVEVKEYTEEENLEEAVYREWGDEWKKDKNGNPIEPTGRIKKYNGYVVDKKK